MWLLLHATLFLPVLINALPTNVAKSSSVSASFESSAAAPLLSFDNGNVGVNFLGYHASAGLGGLLTGNAADGGLHAEAGTPFGQQAGAGLGGTVDASGNRSGYKYHYSSSRLDPLNILPLIRRPSVQTVQKKQKSSEVETLD
ncbi:hypothetical protein TcasGA2_TC007258 [Tribolium castaneum]|uniref:Uncharacterized protein n=1 Tax=Tribolium castaneum TaxID=7070 RepID=D2A0H8_TRICA|nr:hypothetical protein TcasGA2_TC007258 [Tribolium castaneum]